MAKKSKTRTEFGDFQTPLELASEVCGKVRGLVGQPATVIEPTCGQGSFLVAAHERFGQDCDLVGVELDNAHVESARQQLTRAGRRRGLRLLHADFFAFDWAALLAGCDEPILALGNPPWVTNAALGTLRSANLPEKTNFQRLKGLDALTGRSNFDISEWMGIRLLEHLAGRDATIAILIKVAVARKLLRHAWTEGLAMRDPTIYCIDTRKHFGAAVAACLFVCRTDMPGAHRCPVYEDMEGERLVGTIGIDDDDTLVADIDARRRTSALLGHGAAEWRSGIKHDCAKILELTCIDGTLRNGLGERVAVEPHVLFPLLKSSDVVRGRLDSGRWLLVPQQAVAEEPERLRASAPRAWAYLNAHADRLDGRKSRIYRDRPRFSIFGVGPYSFTAWKVAISGLYKTLAFLLVPPVHGRPVVFDDTVYLMPCASEEEARSRAALLGSDMAREFFSSFIFRDAKRPITARTLRKLDLGRLAEAVGNG